MCGHLQSGTHLILKPVWCPGKIGCVAYGPQYSLSPKAVECVIIHLIPCSFWCMQGGNLGSGGAERTLQSTQSYRRCSLIPRLNLRLMHPSKHFPSEKTSHAVCFSGPWWSLERPCSGGLVMLWGPIPSSLHRHRTCRNYDALGLSRLVIAYSDK